MNHKPKFEGYGFFIFLILILNFLRFHNPTFHFPKSNIKIKGLFYIFELVLYLCVSTNRYIYTFPGHIYQSI